MEYWHLRSDRWPTVVDRIAETMLRSRSGSHKADCDFLAEERTSQANIQSVRVDRDNTLALLHHLLHSPVHSRGVVSSREIERVSNSILRERSQEDTVDDDAAAGRRCESQAQGDIVPPNSSFAISSPSQRPK